MLWCIHSKIEEINKNQQVWSVFPLPLAGVLVQGSALTLCLSVSGSAERPEPQQQAVAGQSRAGFSAEPGAGRNQSGDQRRRPRREHFRQRVGELPRNPARVPVPAALPG